MRTLFAASIRILHHQSRGGPSGHFRHYHALLCMHCCPSCILGPSPPNASRDSCHFDNKKCACPHFQLSLQMRTTVQDKLQIYSPPSTPFSHSWGQLIGRKKKTKTTLGALRLDSSMWLYPLPSRFMTLFFFILSLEWGNLT